MYNTVMLIRRLTANPEITKADDKIPTIDEIVANSKNKEQLYQLKAYLEENEKRRKLQNSENKGVIK